MIRKLILALALGSALAATLSNVYAQEEEKKPPKPEAEQRL